MNRVLRIIAVVLLPVAVQSCIFPGDPHDAFKSHMQYNLGRDIRNPSTNWVREENLVQSRKLPNGNIENEYRWRGSCRYFFEVEAVTRIIVNWRLQGEQDCELSPV